MFIDHWSTNACLKDRAFDMPNLINFKELQLSHFNVVVRDMRQTKLLKEKEKKKKWAEKIDVFK